MSNHFRREPYANSRTKNFDVEYALRGIDKPIGVAGYQLTRDVPEKLKDALPDADK